MKHLTDIVNEGLIGRPLVKDDKVKVIALVSEKHIDDNLNLMTGMNTVCLLWSPEDEKGYMVANGGVRWGDGKHWTSIKDIEKIIGKQDWKSLKSIKLSYSYASTIGEPRYYDIDVYSAEVDRKNLMKLYEDNGKGFWIHKRGAATATVSEIIKDWRKKGVL